MENISSYTHVPPGFRFHPTDEELVDYYLRRKANSRRIAFNFIKEVDLHKVEPWDLQEICGTGDEEQNEWYLFSHNDKKYPTGSRTNRATTAGFWKATGRDKAIYSKHNLIGMRKTLVFYKGRAPNGHRSDWIMHEYRLENDANATAQEEGWVVCRLFKKKSTTMKSTSGQNSSWWYDNQVSFMLELDSTKQTSESSNLLGYPQHSRKKELDHDNNNHYRYHCYRRHHSQPPQDLLIHLPLLYNSEAVHPSVEWSNALIPYGRVGTNLQQGDASMQQVLHESKNGTMNFSYDQDALNDQLTDWRVLDKFVASQPRPDDDPQGASNSFSSVVSELLTAPLSDNSRKEESMLENTSISTSSSQIEAWKCMPF